MTVSHQQWTMANTSQTNQWVMSCRGDCVHLFDAACDLVGAKEIVTLRTITDPENVRSSGGEGWNNSSQRSLWSSPERPRSSQRNWSLPRSESGTERETDFVVKDWSSPEYCVNKYGAQENYSWVFLPQPCNDYSSPWPACFFFFFSFFFYFPHHLADFMLLY